MQHKFHIDTNWDSKNGIEMLKNKLITCPMERSVACVTYPNFQLILEAWLSSEDADTQEVEYFEDSMDGRIELAYFTCLKGTDEWQSNAYINSETDIYSKVDFASDNWKQALENIMVDVAERYVEANHYYIDKPNF